MHSHANKILFHKKAFALSLVLKARVMESNSEMAYFISCSTELEDKLFRLNSVSSPFVRKSSVETPGHVPHLGLRYKCTLLLCLASPKQRMKKQPDKHCLSKNVKFVLNSFTHNPLISARKC